MKISYVVDISGRVDIYDEALTGSLKNCESEYIVKLLRPRKGLLSLVPYKFATSTHIIKRVLKLIEGLINYLYLIIIITLKRPSVLHMQWLPFMDYNGLEIYILKIIKALSNNTKIVLTIHNVYPHNMSGKAKIAYNIRYRKACSLINEFIVHTYISKQDVIREFHLSESRVNVCCHGVFVPYGVKLIKSNRIGGKLHILQFGGQSLYKGTDLLVDAVDNLEESLQKKIEVHIVGGISNDFLTELKKKDSNKNIIWKPYFLKDEELYEEINNSDLIVLPYRAISQSGVLLLSIYFEKMIICSDLPSFKETMQGNEGTLLDDVLFFKSEDSKSLQCLLMKYINMEIDEKLVHERIKRLKNIYSWDVAAMSTFQVYNK